jgi:hypothetical protein
MQPMTTTTLIIVNLLLVLGLFAALALVMSTGHRVADHRRYRRPLQFEPAVAAREERELERAA